MLTNIPKEYIAKISKASTYFAFRNGPIKKLYEEGNISEEDFKEIKRYMENHLAYLFNVLLEENNINKFDLIISTMDKFYVNDNEDIILEDDGFESLYNNLFNVKPGIKLKK